MQESGLKTTKNRKYGKRRISCFLYIEFVIAFLKRKYCVAVNVLSVNAARNVYESGDTVFGAHPAEIAFSAFEVKLPLALSILLGTVGEKIISFLSRIYGLILIPAI